MITESKVIKLFYILQTVFAKNEVQMNEIHFHPNSVLNNVSSTNYKYALWQYHLSQ